jgi:hypothetical protein
MSSSPIKAGKHGRWSVLPPVPLFGIGTALVESVEHYMSRLAWISGTTVHHIISLSAPFDEPGARQAGGVSKFCGPSKTFRRRIENLEALTGIETIRCGSFYILKDLLAAPSIGRDSKRKRWCPMCYLKWDEQASWEPLLWSIELQVTCPIHGCLLERQCRRCGAQQNVSVRYCRRRSCSSCGESLGNIGVFQERSNYEIWTENQLSELVKLCASPGQRPISGLASEIFALGLISSANGSRKAEAAVKRIARLLLARRPAGASCRISLRGLIDLCAIQGISVTDILLQPSASASMPLLDHWAGYRSLAHPTSRSARMVLFREGVVSVLESPEELFLPPVSILLRDAKVSRGAAQHACDGLLERYQDRYFRQEGGELGASSGRVFRNAIEDFTSSNFNPFLPCDVATHARRAMKQEKEISLAQGKRITKSALFWCKALERAKAKVLGISAEEHYLATSLGGFAWRSCN